MRKTLLLTCFVLTALVAMAQTKKVAILEVVDREARLSYSQKLVLRSNMARAVANTDGYEAYDRSDVDMIMSEQDFQRTGVVSDAEIRKLGEMTGVSLILVTEAVLMDADNLFVSVKILNVETARVEMTDNIIVKGLNPEEIQKGCNTLARRLFGVGSTASKVIVSALGGGYYSYRGEIMNEKAYMNFLMKNCPVAYEKYHQGSVLSISGWTTFGLGLAMTGVGAGLFSMGFTGGLPSEIAINGIWLLPLGTAVTLCASVPLLHFGNKAKKESVIIYNESCASSSAKPLTLNLTGSSSGLGLALQF